MATETKGAAHRLCLASWERLSTVKGTVIPRVGEIAMIDRAGSERIA